MLIMRKLALSVWIAVEGEDDSTVGNNFHWFGLAWGRLNNNYVL